MNSTYVIVSINSMKDIENITDNTKYINLSINNVDVNVIDYFLLHGQNYMYTDTIDNKNGFIYANYDMFKSGEAIIDNIVDMMPSDITDIEKVRYVYIKLGKILSLDINTIDNKNDVISFGSISTINNIWGALSTGKITNISLSKIFMYICSRIGISGEIINNSIKGNIANKINIKDDFIVVDLFNDISYIQGNFSTHYFDKYNSNKDIDIKIGYINSDYSDYYIEKALKNIDYTDSDIVYKILSLTENIINAYMIGTYELGEVYKYIFNKYCPNYDVRINNFYIFDGNREHFIVVNYNNKYYSYNYNKKKFIEVEYKDIYSNFENKKIGLYNNEDFLFNKEGVVVR